MASNPLREGLLKGDNLRLHHIWTPLRLWGGISVLCFGAMARGQESTYSEAAQFLHRRVYDQCEGQLEALIVQKTTAWNPIPKTSGTWMSNEFNEDHLFQQVVKAERNQAQCQKESLERLLEPLEKQQFDLIQKQTAFNLAGLYQIRQSINEKKQGQIPSYSLAKGAVTLDALEGQVQDDHDLEQLHQAKIFFETALFHFDHPIFKSTYEEILAESQSLEEVQERLTLDLPKTVRRAIEYDQDHLLKRGEMESQSLLLDRSAKEEIMERGGILEQITDIVLNENPQASQDPKGLARTLCALDGKYGRGAKILDFGLTLGLSVPFLLPTGGGAGLFSVGSSTLHWARLSRLKNAGVGALQWGSLAALNVMSYHSMIKECFLREDAIVLPTTNVCRDPQQKLMAVRQNLCTVEALMTTLPLVAGGLEISTKFQPVLQALRDYLQELKSGVGTSYPKKIAETVLLRNDRLLTGAHRQMVKAQQVLQEQNLFEELAKKRGLAFETLEGGDLLPTEARLQHRTLLQRMGRGEVLSESEKQEFSQLALGDSLSFLPFYNQSWIHPLKEGRSISPLLYELKGCSTPLGKGSGTSIFYEHPEFPKYLTQMEQLEVKIYVDPTLGLQKSTSIAGYYRPAQGAIVLGPRNTWAVFIHEVQHAQFDKHIRMVLSKANIKAIQSGQSLGLLLPIRALSSHTLAEIQVVEKMIRQGFSELAINETLSTTRELKTLRVWNVSDRLSVQSYQDYHQIRGLSKKTGDVDTKEFEKLTLQLKESLGVHVLLNYGFKMAKEVVQAGYQFQPLAAILKNPVNYILRDSEGKIYFHRENGSWETYSESNDFEPL